MVVLGCEIGFDHQGAPALGFFRPRRPVRDPGRLREFLAPLPQQALQRLGGGGHAEILAVLAAQDRRARCFARWWRRIVLDAERARQIRIELARRYRSLAPIAGPW